MKKLTLFSALVLLASCSSSISGKAPPDVTFQDTRPVNLPVSDLVIEEGPSAQAASNATSFSVPFEEKVDLYLRHKLHSVGGEKRLRVVIEDSSVKERFEPSANKVAGFLDMAGFDVYDISLILNVGAEDNFGGHKGVRLKLARTIKVSEHASIAERELKQTEGVTALFKELDTNLTRITLQELDLIPYQGGGVGGMPAAPTAPVYSDPYSSGGYGTSNPSPRVITGGPSTGGGASIDSEDPSSPSSGANNGAIVRQEL